MKALTLNKYLSGKMRNKTYSEAFEHYYENLRIGMEVRKLRKASGMTQKKLATTLGISQQVISRLERGDAENPTLETLHKIAVVTGHRLSVQFEAA